MEASAPPFQQRPTAGARPARTLPAAEAPLVGALTLVLTVYLALSGGGYDIVVRSELGILIWWLLLLGVIIGVLPRTRLSRATWVALAALTGLFAWTWLGAGWSKSEELSLVEVGRVATYIGAFLLAACLLTRRSAAAILRGLAAGIAVVCALAVLSKLAPSLFPADATAQFYATPRLRYPFDYSDGVGEFAALGIPLLWYLATGARSVWGRGLAAAGLPVVLLCLAMTVSRGGILAAAVGTVAFLALSPDRLPRLLTGLIAALGTLVLMLALLARTDLINRLLTPAPASQRHSMLLITVVVALAVGLAQAAIALAGQRRIRPRWTQAGPRTARATGASILTVVVAGIVALFASGAAHHLWEQFKQPNAAVSGSSYFRLLSVAGSHRYQYWQVAIRAFESSPWKGIGPGTFQYYWAQHETIDEYVLNAHSLWIETLAELGIIGLALVGGFFSWVLVSGSVRALRAPVAERALRVAAVAGVAAFCAAAAFDWVWQIGVVPIVAMLLCAICVVGRRAGLPGEGAPRASTAAPQRPPVRRRLRLPAARLRLRLPAVRLLLIAGSLVALWTIVLPLATTVAVRRSQAAAQAGQLTAALRYAADAQQLEPGAASPRLQRALLLEQLDDIPAAAHAIAQAERRSPTDWQLWLVASRIATEQDRPRAALRDYLHAKALNPRSTIFEQ